MASGRSRSSTETDLNRNSSAGMARGLTVGQHDDLLERVTSAASNVCKASETIPLLDFLDMVYTPEEKKLWLEAARVWGTRYLHDNGRYMNNIDGRVQASSTSDARVISYGLDHGKRWAATRIAILPTKTANKVLFTTLENTPETQRELHAPYARHMVRCAREWEVFLMGYDKLKWLLKNAPCTRVIKLYFPEIIEYIPMSSNERDYLRKTRANKFSGKLVIDPAERQRIENELGPNWDKIKNHIHSLLMRDKLLRSVGDQDGEETFHPYSELNEHWDFSKLNIRIIFTPRL